jgi:hypothetical protein
MHEFSWVQDEDDDSWKHSHIFIRPLPLFESGEYEHFHGLAFSDDGEYLAVSASTLARTVPPLNPWLFIFKSLNKDTSTMSSQSWQFE